MSRSAVGASLRTIGEGLLWGLGFWLAQPLAQWLGIWFGRISTP